MGPIDVPFSEAAARLPSRPPRPLARPTRLGKGARYVRASDWRWRGRALSPSYQAEADGGGNRALPGGMEQRETTIFLGPDGAGRAAELRLRERPSEGLSGSIWDAGRDVADLMWRPGGEAILPGLRGKVVVELGSGTGVAGIAAAARGARVICTDRGSCLALLEANCARNEEAVASACGELSVAELNWLAVASDGTARLPLEARPDVVLCADCTYDASLLGALVAAIVRVCRLPGSAETEAVVVHRPRESVRVEEVIAAFEGGGFGVLSHEVGAGWPDTSLVRLRRA